MCSIIAFGAIVALIAWIKEMNLDLKKAFDENRDQLPSVKMPHIDRSSFQVFRIPRVFGTPKYLHLSQHESETAEDEYEEEEEQEFA